MRRYFVYLSKSLLKSKTLWIIAGLFFVFQIALNLMPLIIGFDIPMDGEMGMVIYLVQFLFIASYCSLLSVFIFRSPIDNGTELMVSSRPITRINIILTKMLVLVVFPLAINLIATLFILVHPIALQFGIDGQIMYDNFIISLKQMLVFFIGSIVVTLFLASISVLFATLMNKIAAVTVNLLVVIAVFVAGIIVPVALSSFSLPGRYYQTKVTDGNDPPNTYFEWNQDYKAGASLFIKDDGSPECLAGISSTSHPEQTTSYILNQANKSSAYGSINALNIFNDMKHMYSWSSYTNTTRDEFYSPWSTTSNFTASETKLKNQNSQIIDFYLPNKYVCKNPMGDDVQFHSYRNINDFICLMPNYAYDSDTFDVSNGGGQNIVNNSMLGVSCKPSEWSPSYVYAIDVTYKELFDNTNVEMINNLINKTNGLKQKYIEKVADNYERGEPLNYFNSFNLIDKYTLNASNQSDGYTNPNDWWNCFNDIRQKNPKTALEYNLVNLKIKFFLLLQLVKDYRSLLSNSGLTIKYPSQDNVIVKYNTNLEFATVCDAIATLGTVQQLRYSSFSTTCADEFKQTPWWGYYWIDENNIIKPTNENERFYSWFPDNGNYLNLKRFSVDSDETKFLEPNASYTNNNVLNWVETYSHPYCNAYVIIAVFTIISFVLLAGVGVILSRKDFK